MCPYIAAIGIIAITMVGCVVIYLLDGDRHGRD